VKWSKVCQPKARDGFGIRDFKIVNLSLLAKWGWRLLQGGFGRRCCKRNIRIGEVMSGGNDNWPHYASRWWKYIVTIEKGHGTNWFNAEVARKVYDDENTSFWRTKWRGYVSFCDKYPRLYAISNQKEAIIAAMRVEGD
jgi:hypothetical protein